MTPVEERLSELMHEATQSMAGVSFNDVARRVRHYRRAQLASVALAALAVIGRIGTLYYFVHFLILMPLLGKIERPRPLPISIAEAVLGPSAGVSAAGEGQ